MELHQYEQIKLLLSTSTKMLLPTFAKLLE